jgi:hypothetical protein
MIFMLSSSKTLRRFVIATGSELGPMMSGLPQAATINSSLVDIALGLLINVSRMQLSGRVMENDLPLPKMISVPASVLFKMQLPIGR